MPSYESIQFRGTPTGEIVQKTITYTELAPDEVIIKVTLSGLCFTDIHMASQDIALGHEGVGIVQAAGPACKTIKVGDRVGWGYPNKSCGSCELCLHGDDSYCADAEWYGRSNFDTGSLSSIAKRKEEWLFKIPDEIRDEDAAPLMCGGATVWSALIRNCKCYDRVGILGIGGLGHIAIQFLAKMGCDVVVFSSSPSKREEALSLGASEFHCVKDVKNYGELGVRPIDKMIISSSAKAPFEEFYPVMKIRSAVIPLTVAFGDLVAPYVQTVWTGMSINGSSLSPRYDQQKMLDFAARNKIHVIAEKFPMTLEGVNAAFEKLKSGEMRYRGVITWEN
ncbi:hypothetical protein VKT23_020223 [Stygiomarasmius scandens]|uniref:Enoyl reductase (ER) domain-containing protein n=1 Tax=Marasmiellus scandens TaxID=2682957 RepID=A0ABR1IJI0_9AGAR